MSAGSRGLACLLFLGVAALSAPPASAQMDSREGIELQHQLLELKRDVQNLRDQMSRGGSGVAPAPSRGSSDSSEITVQLLSRVEALEGQVRRLRGQVDEVANQTQRQGDDLNKKIGDLNFRVQSLEPGGGGAAPARAPALTWQSTMRRRMCSCFRA